MNTTTQNYLVALFVLGCTMGIAQQSEVPTPGGLHMETMFQADAEKMMLDEASETQYLEISLRYAEALKALRDSDMGRMAKFSELKSIRKNKNKEMKALLSKEQYKIYEDIQAQRQQEMKARRKGGRK